MSLQRFNKDDKTFAKRVNGGGACGDTPYRETNVDTSYMRIPNENSVC